MLRMQGFRRCRSSRSSLAAKSNASIGLCGDFSVTLRLFSSSINLRESNHRGVFTTEGVGKVREREKSTVDLRTQRKWSSRVARRALLEEIAQEYGVKEPKDWKKVTSKDIASVKGSAGMLRIYSGSLFDALVDLFPECKWDPIECRPRVPKAYWDSSATRRAFMDRIAEKYGVEKTEDWQRVSREVIGEEGGYRLLSLYQGSMSNLLSSIYPEKEIGALSCRSKAPNNHWDDDDNCREALELLCSKREVQYPWELSRQSVIDNGLASVLKRFKGSYRDALLELYPLQREEVEKMRLRRRAKPLFLAKRGHWSSMEARKKFLDGIAEQYGISRPSDWKKVSTTDIYNEGGSGLLKKYGNSIHKALVDVYGAEDDEAWGALHCRTTVPSAYWDDASNIEGFLSMLKTDLRIQDDADWFRISKDQIHQYGGAGLLRKMSLLDALKTVWPTKKWRQPERQPAAKRSMQRYLYVAVSGIFQRLSPTSASAQQLPAT